MNWSQGKCNVMVEKNHTAPCAVTRMESYILIFFLQKAFILPKFAVSDLHYSYVCDDFFRIHTKTFLNDFKFYIKLFF